MAKTAALISWLALSVLVGIGFLYISWDHNPQGEFHEAGEIYWSNWLPLGLIPFVLTGGPIALVWFIFEAIHLSGSTEEHCEDIGQSIVIPTDAQRTKGQ